MLTSPHDWPALLPLLQEDQKAGLTIREIANKHHLPSGSVGRWLLKSRLKAEAIQSPGESPIRDELSQAIQEKNGEERESVASVPEASQLEKDREAARQAMRDGLSGKKELSSQQTAIIRLLLKDELEPETERNLYAGRPLEELAERSLVLTVSIFGLVKTAALLRELSKAGTLDLGLDWSPEQDPPTPVPEPTAPPEVEQVEWKPPQPVVPEPHWQTNVTVTEVETLD